MLRLGSLCIVRLVLVLAALGNRGHDAGERVVQVGKNLFVIALVIRVGVPDLLEEHGRCDDAGRGGDLSLV